MSRKPLVFVESIFSHCESGGYRLLALRKQIIKTLVTNWFRVLGGKARNGDVLRYESACEWLERDGKTIALPIARGNSR